MRRVAWANCIAASRDRGLADGHFDHAERLAPLEILSAQRHGDGVDGDVPFRPPLERAAMRVSVEDGVAAIAVDRLFKSRRSEKRVDLRRLAGDGSVNW